MSVVNLNSAESRSISTALSVFNNSQVVPRLRSFLENCQNSVLDHRGDPIKLFYDVGPATGNMAL